MDAIAILEEYASGNGVALEFDDDGACTLPLSDDRVLHLQLRNDGAELDFLALLGTVPEEVRAFVFERLLSANYYWKETQGATLSWHADLEQVVLTYPVRVDSVDGPTLRGILDRFLDLQAAWSERLRELSVEADEAGDADLELSDLLVSGEGSVRKEESGSEVRIDA